MPEPSNADILAKLIQHDAALAADVAELRHLSSRVDGIAETVDSHSEVLRDLQQAFRGHAAELTDMRGTLDAHTATLAEHTAMLESHTAMLGDHTTMLEDHGRRLTSHGDLLATILASVNRIEARLADR